MSAALESPAVSAETRRQPSQHARLTSDLSRLQRQVLTPPCSYVHVGVRTFVPLSVPTERSQICNRCS